MISDGLVKVDLRPLLDGKDPVPIFWRLVQKGSSKEVCSVGNEFAMVYDKNGDAEDAVLLIGSL